MHAEDIIPTFLKSNIYIRICLPKALTLTRLRSYEMFEVWLIVRINTSLGLLGILNFRLLRDTFPYRLHQQKTFPSGRNGSVRVDALRQSRQRHPGGELLRARRQYHASRCISPSDRRFAVSSRSENLSSRSFYIKLEESRKVRRYDTTRP
jgi:hypothetical protein